MNFEIMNIHEPMNYVDILDAEDVRLIEQKFVAIFGPDADISEIILIIETFSERNRPKIVQCQMRGISFRVNLSD